MRLQFADFGREFQYPVLFCLGTMPVAVSIVSAFFPRYAPWCLVFGLVYLLFAWCATVFPGKVRYLWGFLGFLALVGLAFAMPNLWVFLPVSGIFGVLLLRSLSIGGWRWDQEISLQGHLLGLAVYLLCYLAPRFMEGLGQKILSGSAPVMGPCLWAYSIFILLSMNRDSLFFAAKGKAMTSKVMHRHNMLLLAALVAVCSVLALIPGVVKAVIQVLLWLFAVFIRDPEEVVPPTHGPLDGTMPSETEPTSTWVDPDPISEEYMFAVGYVFIFAVSVAALVLLAQAMRKLLPKFRQWLKQFMATTNEDYTDEITDLRSQEGQKGTAWERIRALGNQLQTGELPPDRKIRRRYRQMRRSNRWSSSSTARETLPSEAAGLYEKARYSAHPVTQDDYREFKNLTKKN